MDGTKDGNDGGDIAAFSGIGFLDIGACPPTGESEV